MILLRPALVFFWLCAAFAAHGHPANIASARVQVERSGEVAVTLRIDYLAFALGVSHAEANPDEELALLRSPRTDLEARLEEAAAGFREEARLSTDAGPATLRQIELPDLATTLARASADTANVALPVMATIKARFQLPPSAREFSVRLPFVVGDIVVSVEQPGREPATALLPAGKTSSLFRVLAAAADEPPGGRYAWLAVLGRFVRIGFEHILPRGLDHMLFVLGLFLFSARWRPLLWQVSAFTLAHSLTLGFAAAGVLRLDSGVVEPLIALSIVLVAVDNVLRRQQLRSWRVAVVFGFGLIHGLGFAGALVETGLPAAHFLAALAGFNVGVELGQIAVVALAFAIVGWFRDHAGYRRWVVVPGSVAIAAVAAVWTVQRGFQF